jgi:hypothetical protein
MASNASSIQPTEAARSVCRCADVIAERRKGALAGIRKLSILGKNFARK